LDGADDALEVGSWMNLQSFSIALWVRPSANQQQYANIIDNNHRSGVGWALQQNSNATNEYTWGPADGAPAPTFFTLQPGQWQHVVLTRDATSHVNSVYVDGVLVGSTTGTADILYDGTEDLRLGRWGGGGRHWSGDLDEVAIYPRALSPNDIAVVMQRNLGDWPSGVCMP
jgi:hypothetical protein